MAEALVAVLRLAASAAATARPQSRSGRHGSCAARVPCPGPSPFRRGRLCARAAVAGPPEVDDDDAMTIDNLRRFFDVNVGKWNGAFYVRARLPLVLLLLLLLLLWVCSLQD